ncbi:MAG: hypothetical protein QG571_301, partial [Pseudomonadota bacterium]|nr:hypothetical protein [Pseudomonadota bacterium]
MNDDAPRATSVALPALLEDAARRSAAYLRALERRPVRPDPDAVQRLARLDEPLPPGPTDPAGVLALLDELVSPATMATAGPRFFGFVIGGSLPAALAANWLATAWDQNACLAKITPGVAQVEAVALRWLVEVLGLPPQTEGAFVTGATMANFTALAAARHVVLARTGWNVEADGLYGAPPITVVVGAEAHPTLLKSLGLLGLGRNRVVRVPTDRRGRMRADRLPSLDGPTIVCVQAGNINTGEFDPFGEICSAARAAGAWVHVDGAFGLWARAAPQLAPLADGVELADSWATDAHKWLNVPYDSGLAFCAHPEAHAAAVSYTATYLVGSGTATPTGSDFSLESSRRARGFAVWAALRELGRDGVADLVDRACALARRFASALAEGGAEIANDVVLNQVLVRFGDDERTDRVVAAVQQEGTCWLGGTTWRGRRHLRISVINH